MAAAEEAAAAKMDALEADMARTEKKLAMAHAAEKYHTYGSLLADGMMDKVLWLIDHPCGLKQLRKLSGFNYFRQQLGRKTEAGSNEPADVYVQTQVGPWRKAAYLADFLMGIMAIKYTNNISHNKLPGVMEASQLSLCVKPESDQHLPHPETIRRAAREIDALVTAQEAEILKS